MRNQWYILYFKGKKLHGKELPQEENFANLKILQYLILAIFLAEGHSRNLVVFVVFVFVIVQKKVYNFLSFSYFLKRNLVIFSGYHIREI